MHLQNGETSSEVKHSIFAVISPRSPPPPLPLPARPPTTPLSSKGKDECLLCLSRPLKASRARSSPPPPVDARVPRRECRAQGRRAPGKRAENIPANSRHLQRWTSPPEPAFLNLVICGEHQVPALPSRGPPPEAPASVVQHLQYFRRWPADPAAHVGQLSGVLLATPRWLSAQPGMKGRPHNSSRIT